jgi:hypothetical protein
MLGELQVLHVNTDKRRTAHWSLFCDVSLAGFDALSVVEPYIYEELAPASPRFQSSETGSCSNQVPNRKERRDTHTEQLYR